jgi:hypothetical protein
LDSASDADKIGVKAEYVAMYCKDSDTSYRLFGYSWAMLWKKGEDIYG